MRRELFTLLNRNFVQLYEVRYGHWFLKGLKLLFLLFEYFLFGVCGELSKCLFTVDGTHEASWITFVCFLNCANVLINFVAAEIVYKLVGLTDLIAFV